MADKLLQLAHGTSAGEAADQTAPDESSKDESVDAIGRLALLGASRDRVGGNLRLLSGEFRNSLATHVVI